MSGHVVLYWSTLALGPPCTYDELSCFFVWNMLWSTHSSNFVCTPLQIFFASSNHLGMSITSPALADQNSTTFHLTGLAINTMYEVLVRAVTGAGPGENVTDSVRTEEDGEG